jgi:hypothetical protein
VRIVPTATTIQVSARNLDLPQSLTLEMSIGRKSGSSLVKEMRLPELAVQRSLKVEAGLLIWIKGAAVGPSLSRNDQAI